MKLLRSSFSIILIITLLSSLLSLPACKQKKIKIKDNNLLTNMDWRERRPSPSSSWGEERPSPSKNWRQERPLPPRESFSERRDPPRAKRIGNPVAAEEEKVHELSLQANLSKDVVNEVTQNARETIRKTQSVIFNTEPINEEQKTLALQALEKASKNLSKVLQTAGSVSSAAQETGNIYKEIKITSDLKTARFMREKAEKTTNAARLGRIEIQNQANHIQQLTRKTINIWTNPQYHIAQPERAIVEFWNSLDNSEQERIHDSIQKTGRLILNNKNINSLDGIEGLFSRDERNGITLIGLNKNRKLKSLPANFSQLFPNLQSLHLKETGLEEIPSNFEFKDLKMLLLAHTQLTDIPRIFSEFLPQLRTLILVRNNIRELFNESFTPFQDLILLKVSHTLLSRLPDGFGSTLVNLKHLNIVGNPNLQELPVNFGPGLENLGVLNLGHNALTTLPTNFGQGLKNLELLFLNDNKLRSLPKFFGTQFEKLKLLNLAKNNLTPDEITRVKSNLPRGCKVVSREELVSHQEFMEMLESRKGPSSEKMFERWTGERMGSTAAAAAESDVPVAAPPARKKRKNMKSFKKYLEQKEKESAAAGATSEKVPATSSPGPIREEYLKPVESSAATTAEPEEVSITPSPEEETVVIPEVKTKKTDKDKFSDVLNRGKNFEFIPSTPPKERLPVRETSAAAAAAPEDVKPFPLLAPARRPETFEEAKDRKKHEIESGRTFRELINELKNDPNFGKWGVLTLRGLNLISLEGIEDLSQDFRESIIKIRLTRNPLQELPPNLGILFPNLQELFLEKTSLTKFPIGLSPTLSKLETLVISTRTIIKQTPLKFPYDFGIGMINLKKLDLSGNNLKKLPEFLGQGMESLERLILRSNKLSWEKVKKIIPNLPKGCLIETRPGRAFRK